MNEKNTALRAAQDDDELRDAQVHALLLKYIEDSRHIWEGRLKEVRYTTVGSVIGTHVGPGAVVVAFFKK